MQQDFVNRGSIFMERTTQNLDRIIAVCLMSFVVFSLFSISLTQISLAVGGVVWLTRVQLTHTWEQVRLPVGIPFLIFVLACVLAVVTSVDFAQSLKPLKKILLIITFFWVVNTVRNTQQRNFLFNLLMGAACAAAMYGFYQAVTQGVSLTTRVEGTMSIYMTFAGLLMLIALMATGRFLFAPTREGWIGTVVFLLIVCLLLTLTRQAWLGFLAGLVFLVGLRKPVMLFALPVLVGLVILVAPGSLNERLQSMVNLKDATFQTRVALWRGGWEIFKDHPVTGCGFKCVDTIYSQYPDHAEVLKKYKGMHNNFLQLAVDTGLIGLGAWLSIWAVYFLSLYRRLNQLGPNQPDRWLYLGAAAVAVGFLTGGLFEVNFYDSEVIMLLYFLMALPFSVDEQGASDANSDHFNGTVFFNPWDSYRKKSFWDYLKWKTASNPYQNDKKNAPVFPIIRHQIDYSAKQNSPLTVTWVGHVTVLIQLDGVNILTDPIWGDHALIHKRITPPAVSWEDLPPIHAVVISHNHYDHLDKNTVKKLGNGTRFFVPMGMRKWFGGIGITNVVELDWWEAAEFNGINFYSVPTQHWCARGLFDRDRVLWSGWVVAGASGKFYYSGDTGYFEGFKEIGKRFPDIDLAILPIGHYEPRWFMKPYHINGHEALQAFQDLKARQFMGVHWGTFDLTDEPLDLPPRILREEIERQGLDPARYWVFAHGETRRLQNR